MALIYHITTKQDYKAAEEQGFYVAPSLETEGFIHCSQEHQLNGVLERYYKDKSNLLMLVIDPKRLNSELKYELAPSINENFPHIYGPINLDAVISVEKI